MTGWIAKTSQFLKIGICGLVAVSFVSGCSSMNPFDDMEAPSLPSLPKVSKWFEKEKEKLPGERIAVIQPRDADKIETTAAFAPFTIPTAILNPVWTQPGGVASNAPGHLSLQGGLQVRWTADAGRGSGSKGKLTASPIIFDGKVFTLDTRGKVSAFSISSGSQIWAGSLTPETEKDYEGFGGGLASDGGRLFVATGYGTVSAINPSNGAILWTKSLGVPVRSSPTAAGGNVFVVTTEGRVFCLAGVDGQELWRYSGLPESAALLTNASPAVSGDIVVVPFSSGEVIALKISTGKPIWAEALTRRRGDSSLATLTNPARPVIDRGTVFALGHAGRMVATTVSNGERVWDRNIQGLQMPWVVGDTVFVVDVNGKLLAMKRSDGKLRWVAELPKEISWNGPVLAGGKLWLVSSSGKVIGVDALTGKVASQRDLDTKVYIAPIVANGKMFVMSDKARLIAIN